jgi:hypothetical protein
MNYTDIIIFLVIIIIIIAIVVVNINSVIDRKLSNVEVNIPPINIPPPQVTVKLQKSCTSDEYTVLIDREDGNQTSQTVALSPITGNNTEHFGSVSDVIKNTVINTNNNVTTLSESLSDVVQKTVNKIQDDIKESNAQNLMLPKIATNIVTTVETTKDKSTENTVKVYPKYLSISKTDVADIKYPEDTEVIQYGDYKCYKKAPPVLVSKHEPSKCANQSINNMQRDAFGYMASNLKGVAEVKFPSCNKYESNLIGNEIDEVNEVDITQLYRENQTFVKAYLEDPVVRGYNLDSYGGYSPLFTTGKISIEKDVNNPKPKGYIFQNSPAYNRE